MSTMRAIQVAEAGGALELVEREVPEVGDGQVRVRVQACGVCHSDMWAKEGALPITPYPIVPGHEVVEHYTTMADVELKAFHAAVTDWELRRGFERM